MERGTMPMSKNKKILLMLAKGGATQSDIAAALHVSKRDVSAGAKVMRECGLTFDAVSSMDADAVDDMFFAKEERRPNDAYLRPDMAALVERKKMSRKLPVKLFWLEYCERAAAEGKLAYAYQTFCEMFADAAGKMGATRHFSHEPGAKCFIDWAGDVAHLTDKLLGTRTKVYVLVVTLPFSDKFWAEGFCDMRQKSWQEGQIHAFEEFGGVPRMWVPDNAATATDRAAAPRVTLVNREYERFAEHYGAAVLPARVRRPRDKSVAESCVDLVERWIIGPSGEMTFYTIDEFNEFCAEKVAWLNSRPFSAKDGSRDSVFEEERMHLMPLPAERYEMCEWRSAKVAPDYHVTVDYMHYSVDHSLIGDALKGSELFAYKREAQMVFQDPYASLDPRMTVSDIIAEGMDVHHLYQNKAERAEKIYGLLEKVGLNKEHANRFIHEFSGGQRQRIGIARALAMEPKFLVMDEPISALDMSIRAQVLNLLRHLQKERGITYLFIAHDLSVMRYISDRIAVIHKGDIVELADAEELVTHAIHPYTRSLLSAIPMPNPRLERKKKLLVYDPAMHDYSKETPQWRQLRPNHFVLCSAAEAEQWSKEV